MAGANVYQVPARGNDGKDASTEINSQQAALTAAKGVKSIRHCLVAISFENDVTQRWDRTLYADQNRW